MKLTVYHVVRSVGNFHFNFKYIMILFEMELEKCWDFYLRCTQMTICERKMWWKVRITPLCGI